MLREHNERTVFGRLQALDDFVRADGFAYEAKNVVRNGCLLAPADGREKGYFIAGR